MTCLTIHWKIDRTNHSVFHTPSVQAKGMLGSMYCRMFFCFLPEWKGKFSCAAYSRFLEAIVAQSTFLPYCQTRNFQSARRGKTFVPTAYFMQVSVLFVTMYIYIRYESYNCLGPPGPLLSIIRAGLSCFKVFRLDWDENVRFAFWKCTDSVFRIVCLSRRKMSRFKISWKSLLKSTVHSPVISTLTNAHWMQ